MIERIAVGDIRLNVAVRRPTGGSQEPPLLLLHGFTGEISNWAALADRLAVPEGGSDGWESIAVDLPGHGCSDAPDDPARYGFEQLSSDLVALLDRLAVQRTHVLGYSMGGRVALGLTVTHPERVASLVLESASPGLRDPAERAARARADSALADSVERDGVEAFVARWEALPLFASQTRLPAVIRALLQAQRLRNRPLGLANSLRGLGTGVQRSFWDRLSDITVATLLITGADDEKFCETARAMTVAMPRARHVVVADAGHAVHLEQPARFARLIAAFLFEQRNKTA